MIRDKVSEIRDRISLSRAESKETGRKYLLVPPLSERSLCFPILFCAFGLTELATAALSLARHESLPHGNRDSSATAATRLPGGHSDAPLREICAAPTVLDAFEGA